MRILKKYIFSFLAVLVICTTIKVIACALPEQAIRDHIKSSANNIEISGNYPTLPIVGGSTEWEDNAWSMMDLFTEWIIVNSVYMTDAQSALTSAMNNTYVSVDGDFNPSEALTYLIDHEEPGDACITIHAPQYWWGSISVLRFLFLFFDYSQIMICFGTCFLALFLSVCIRLYECEGKKLVFSFVAAMLLIFFPTVMFAVHMGATFIIVFVAILCICTEAAKPGKIYMTMMVCGMLTAYFDWMSTPVITCSMPLAVAMLVLRKKDFVDTFGRKFMFTLRSGLIWCMGYGGMLLSKWGISSVILKENVFEQAFERVVSDSAIEGDAGWYVIETLQRMFSMFLSNKLNVQGLWIVAVVLTLVCLYRIKNMRSTFLILLGLGMIPFVWTGVFQWHSHEHFWFTYRTFLSTAFAVCSIIFYSLAQMKNQYTGAGDKSDDADQSEIEQI